MPLFKRKYIIIAIIFLLAMVVPIYYWFDPSQSDFMPRCVFKTYLHIECPGCGFQRALHALLHGDIQASLAFNPFLIISIPILILACTNELIITHSQASAKIVRLTKINKWILHLYIALYLAWFVIRNIYNIN
jgi:hypothetical protein